MGQEYLSPELNAKVKKNLLWIFIFAVIMIFAGLTSAYLVQRGGTFWVAVPLPDGFNLSTILIFASSGLLFLARYLLKQGKEDLMKATLVLAFLSGAAFGWFQYVGANQLFNSGYAVSGPIVPSEGRYGQIFSLSYEGKMISFKDEQFVWKGEFVSDEMNNEIVALGAEFERAGVRGVNNFNIDDYGTKFILFYKDAPITYANNKLYKGEEPLSKEVCRQLYKFGENLAHERGDFIMNGVYGKDFWIYYDGKALEYENRQFYRDGKKLSPKLENELYGAANNASSFIYALAGVHFLHWLGGIIALLVVLIRGLSNKYTKQNYLGLTLGSNYMHFLGILWLYLYLFLIFIH